MHFPEMKCFVLMPFGSRSEYAKGRKEADFIFKKIISPAVQKALNIEVNEKTVVREIDNNESGLITKSIIQRIAEAPLVIVDIAGHNANVFFEMGVRYSLMKKNTVLIRQPDVAIPFDLANFRHHTYEVLDDEAADKLADTIISSLKANSGSNRTDSPVYEIFPALEVEANIANERRMPWKEFKERNDKIRETLIGAYQNNSYRPDAIIGITKGGAAFADFLTQKMPHFQGATLALWADRGNDPVNMFENSINRKMLEGLLEHLKMTKEPNEHRLLLVDEIIASGTSYRMAVKLIMGIFPECHLRFLPMVYRESHNFTLVGSRFLWKHKAFDFGDDKINDLHLTNWADLPWGKDIRRS